MGCLFLDAVVNGTKSIWGFEVFLLDRSLRAVVELLICLPKLIDTSTTMLGEFTWSHAFTDTHLFLPYAFIILPVFLLLLSSDAPPLSSVTDCPTVGLSHVSVIATLRMESSRPSSSDSSEKKKGLSTHLESRRLPNRRRREIQPCHGRRVPLIQPCRGRRVPLTILSSARLLSCSSKSSASA